MQARSDDAGHTRHEVSHVRQLAGRPVRWRRQVCRAKLRSPIGQREADVRRNLAIIAIMALAIGMAVTGLALATPGSNAVNTELARQSVPKLTAHFVNRDIVVTEFSFAPGGVTGWHSHPGKVIVGVARGSITLYRGTDPACAGTTYTAGEVFIEHPAVVHQAVNEGTVATVLNATYLGVPIGQSPRIDEAQPVNCA